METCGLRPLVVHNRYRYQRAMPRRHTGVRCVRVAPVVVGNFGVAYNRSVGVAVTHTYTPERGLV